MFFSEQLSATPSRDIKRCVRAEPGHGRQHVGGILYACLCYLYALMKIPFAGILLLATLLAQQWARISVPTTASLRGLNAVSDKVVWASGSGGTVIRTLDGGKNWDVLTVAGAQDLDFRGIHGFDANTAVVLSSGPAEKGQAHIYRTTDGGKSWQQVIEENTPGIFLDAVAFWDANHGIVLSDPVNGKFVLFRTEDGGATWKQVSTPTLPPALPNEGAFAASNSCLTVQGKSNVWFATGGASVARVFRSNDGGETWQVSETPMHPANASSGIFSLYFSDAQHGLASGGDYQHPESSNLPSIMRTTDGGKTWRPAETTDPAGIYFSSVVEAEDRGKAYVIAAGISGLFTGKAGDRLNKDASENLNTVAAAGPHGELPWWAVGPKGTIIKRSK